MRLTEWGNDLVGDSDAGFQVCLGQVGRSGSRGNGRGRVAPWLSVEAMRPSPVATGDEITYQLIIRGSPFLAPGGSPN